MQLFNIVWGLITEVFVPVGAYLLLLFGLFFTAFGFFLIFQLVFISIFPFLGKFFRKNVNEPNEIEFLKMGVITLIIFAIMFYMFPNVKLMICSDEVTGFCGL